MTARASFKQSDADRAIKAFQKNGLRFGGVKVAANGDVFFLTLDQLNKPIANSFDEPHR